MSDQDICGYEDTTTGQPCRHPAGSCPVTSHAEAAPDGGNPQGRPSKFTDDRAQAAIEAAELGKSIRGCERAAGVSHGTIDNWLDRNPRFETADGDERQFFSSFRRARGVGETTCIENGRSEDGDASFEKFLLASSFDYKKTEKRELTGDEGGAIEVSIGGDDGPE